MIKTIGIAALVALIVGGGVAFYAISTIPQPLGAAGQNHTSLETFYAGIVGGGPVISVTTSTTPLSANQICNNANFNITLPTNGATLSLATSTNLFASCLSYDGARKDIYIRNTSSTGSFTLAGSDSSSTLAGATSSVNAATLTRVDFIRMASGTQAWLQEEVTVYR